MSEPSPETPLEPPGTSNPFTSLLIPGIVIVVLVIALVVGVIPFLRSVATTKKNMGEALRPPRPVQPAPGVPQMP
jgi:hypothetical protein